MCVYKKCKPQNALRLNQINNICLNRGKKSMIYIGRQIRANSEKEK